MKYIKLYENFDKNIKNELLAEYLEIKPTQISKTDNYIYDTFSKDGNETYLLIKKSELDIMTTNEIDQYIFNILDFNDIDLLRIIINNLDIKIIDYMYDFDDFCQKEYETYNAKIKHPDADALNLLSNSTKENTQKYADAFLKKDPKFVMHHINWLMEYDYSYNNDNVKDFFNETFDTNRLLNENKYDMVFKFLIYRCQQNKEEREKGSRNISTFVKYHGTPIFMFRIPSDN